MENTVKSKLLAGLVCVFVILILSATAQTNEIGLFELCEQNSDGRPVSERFSTKTLNHFYRMDSDQAKFSQRQKLQERSRSANNNSRRNE